MSYVVNFLGVILVAVILNLSKAQLPPGVKTVSTVTFINFGGPTTYNDVKSYTCGANNQLATKKEPRSLPEHCLGQFQDDFAYIFRGPMEFKYIGVFEPSGGSWNAKGYWSSGSGAKVWGQKSIGGSAQQQGVVFTGNVGKFTLCNGNEQGYMGSNGATGSSEPETFGGKLAKGVNMQVMSDEKCDSSCGYYEGIGHKGWAGKAPGYSRMFVHVATMPEPGTSPASWLLNGRLVRTRQYGKDTCYTRENGQPTCGELDMFEVIEEQNIKDSVSSTIYTSKGRVGNSGAYTFKRNYDKYNTFITIIHEDGYIQIIQLDDADWKYGQSVPQKVVDDWLARRELIISTPGKQSPANCKAPKYHNFAGFSDEVGFKVYVDPTTKQEQHVW